MELTFEGAAQTVTGSRHRLTVNGHQLLLDCGLFQGRRRETYQRNLNFSFPPEKIDAVVLSHAHIDHCGNLPNLVGQGFTGPIHTTHATRHLADLMLQDSAHIHESDAAYLNKKRERRGGEPVQPLYTMAQARAAVRLLRGASYGQRFEPVPGVQAELVEAGHILGSAAVVLTLQEGRQRVRLMFSGDIGRRDLPIVQDPLLPDNVDYLIMECTYGDRLHDPPDRAEELLRDLARRTLERRGKLIIPAFAVGRTQTLVYAFRRLIERGELPRVPIYVDSPLAVDVSDAFRQHPEFFDDDARAALRRSDADGLFGFDLLTYTRSVDESKALNERRDPMVVISASGMAETGRILHHLRHALGDERNAVLITSWMAPHTLGRRLVERQPQVRIFGEPHEVRAEVAVINGFSAHADQAFLQTYAGALRGRVRRIFLVHGEPRPAQALTEQLRAAGLPDVDYPAPGTRVTL